MRWLYEQDVAEGTVLGTVIRIMYTVGVLLTFPLQLFPAVKVGFIQEWCCLPWSEGGQTVGEGFPCLVRVFIVLRVLGGRMTYVKGLLGMRLGVDSVLKRMRPARCCTYGKLDRHTRTERWRRIPVIN